MENGLLKSILSKNEQEVISGIKSDESYIEREHFWSAIRVYVEKPNVVNKKVCGYEQLWIGTHSGDLNSTYLIQNVVKITNDDGVSENKRVEILKSFFFESEITSDGNDSITWDDVISSGVNFVSIRKVLPKLISKPLLEIIIIDAKLNTASFVSEIKDCSVKTIPNAPYSLYLRDGDVNIQLIPGFAIDALNKKWLFEVLLPHLNKWYSQADATCSSEPSLKYVNIQQYNEVYQRLKNKYGKPLVEMWNESTDPLKFVYEDIAIASYLIVTWEQERISRSLEEKQSFVDIGCGNGLLVYLLASEGYRGYGMDLRRRKIWNTFPDYVVLKEESFKPSDEFLFPKYDWLIGNHSDELTPWLPVIAAKSSIDTRFFVIPCCAHDFQSKFIRKKSGVSLYAEYLEYVKRIGEICGFEVLRDKLRIPSTKRVCFIGQKRAYTADKYDYTIGVIDDFIKERCGVSDRTNETKTITGDAWSDGFQAREVVEKVRNCTRIKSEVREELLRVVTMMLLKEENMIDVDDGSKKFKWNKGIKLELSTIANSLSKKQRSFLKNECGGLQTLLRNHRFIFVVQAACVSLRVPQSASEKCVPSERLRQKDCWFFHNHPQGCTLASDECTFKH